jgi:phosphohistidine phosphatase
MKTLFLCRHAKSSWDEPGLKDFDRPLMERGIRKTEKIIRYLRKNEIHPDLIISSPAVRALETAKLVAEGLGYPADKIVLESNIYEAWYERILDVICGTPDEIGTLMIFGHNPGISEVANVFLHPPVDMLPTSGVACFTFKTDRWEKIPGIHPHSQYTLFPNKM